MTKRYLVLAMLASAMWGVSYTITYLALRLYGVNQLLTLTYLFSVLLLMVAVVVRGYNIRSILIGLWVSPINYVISYLYTDMAEYVGGLTALVSSSYVIPLMILDYLREGSVNVRYVVSAMTLLGSLYLLFQGYDGSLSIALLLMVLNLMYSVVLSRVGDVDTLNFVFGQSIGTLLISLIIMHYVGDTLYLKIPYVYYPILLALVGNVVPYSLYAVSIRHAGPTQTSLTTSVEVACSLLTSVPFQPLPTNAFAWALLAVSMLSISIDVPKDTFRNLLFADNYEIRKIEQPHRLARYDDAWAYNQISDETPRHYLRSVIAMLGKRKVI